MFAKYLQLQVEYRLSHKASEVYDKLKQLVCAEEEPTFLKGLFCEKEIIEFVHLTL